MPLLSLPDDRALAHRERPDSSMQDLLNSGAWAALPDEALLQVRISDLGVSLANSPVQRLIEQTCRELRATGLRLEPHFWISDEWFCPEGVPGVAVPFYLVHPRLRRLEKRMHGRVEGGSRSECLKILRHELQVKHDRRERIAKLVSQSTSQLGDLSNALVGSPGLVLWCLVVAGFHYTRKCTGRARTRGARPEPQ